MRQVTSTARFNRDWAFIAISFRSWSKEKLTAATQGTLNAGGPIGTGPPAITGSGVRDRRCLRRRCGRLDRQRREDDLEGVLSGPRTFVRGHGLGEREAVGRERRRVEPAVGDQLEEPGRCRRVHEPGRDRDVADPQPLQVQLGGRGRRRSRPVRRGGSAPCRARTSPARRRPRSRRRRRARRSARRHARAVFGPLSITTSAPNSSALARRAGEVDRDDPPA